MRFAPIGLSGMFNGGGAVQACSAHASDRHGGPGASFTVAVRGCGHFLAYCSHSPAAVTAERLPLYHTYDPATGAVRVEVPSTESLACQLTFTINRA